jgi:hypothetical protein
MSPVKYELGLNIPDDDIPHSDRRENFIFYNLKFKLIERFEQTLLLMVRPLDL